MELLDVCLRTIYFQVGDKFFQQKEGMAVGSSLSPIVSNIYMEFFEKLVLNSAQYKPSLWLRYVDNTSVIWPHGPELLQNFLSHLNSLRPSIHFTMEMESGGAITCLDVSVVTNGKTVATEIYRKPAHTGRYLNCDSNHVKRGLIQGLHNRASTICQDQRDLCVEINRLKQDLQLNGYPQGFIDSVIDSSDGALSKETKQDKPLCYVHIPYVKGGRFREVQAKSI